MLFRKFKILESLKNFHVVYLLFLVVYFAEAQEVTSIDNIVNSITENAMIDTAKPFFLIVSIFMVLIISLTFQF